MRRDTLATWPVWLLAVGLVAGGVVYYQYKTRYEPEARISQAQQGCKHIDEAIRQYIEHPGNARHEPPRTLEELDHPPWGGSSLLPLGSANRTDPWGKPYEFERAKKANGDEFIIVKATAPDGTPISQFGIGPNSVPKFE